MNNNNKHSTIFFPRDKNTIPTNISNELFNDEKRIQNNIIDNALKISNEVSTLNKVISPCRDNVLILPYEKNPYKGNIEISESGLVLGLETNLHKSLETGELEEDDISVAVAKVIAIGPNCKDIKVGDDVYLMKVYARPIPFLKKGYWLANEAHIYCKVNEG